jgi:uncharacterized protein (DUF1330 family)
MYGRYCRAVPAVIENHGGRYLANSEEITPLAGDWRPDKIVLLEFDSMQELRDCFQSEEYKSIVHRRIQSTSGRAVIVRGG